MKFDFHCHTKKTKEGDPFSRNVSEEVFLQKIRDSGVKIVAITNHNHFDLDQYNKLRELVSEDCQVWPGVELDVLSKENERYHIIVINNPKTANVFSDNVIKLIDGKKPDDVSLTIEDMIKILDDTDTIYIPHYDKPPSIQINEYKRLRKLTRDTWRVFCETRNVNTLGILTNHNHRAIIGTDVRDWSNYETLKFSELRLGVDSYDQFCLLAKRDPSVVKTLLKRESTHKVTARPHSTTSFELEVYREINVIFGQKGTGKSEILKSIHDSLKSDGMTCELYEGYKKEENFKNLLSMNNAEKDLEIMQIDPCHNEFQFIKLWTNSNPRSLDRYIKWIETRGNNKNKEKLKIVENSKIIYADPPPTISEDMKNIGLIINLFKKINIKNYLTSDDESKLETLMKQLYNVILKKLFKEKIEMYSTELTNFSLLRIKEHADEKSNTISKPEDTGFFEFANKRLLLRSTLLQIQKNLSVPIKNQKKILGHLDNVGEIYIETRYRMLDRDEKSKAEEFRSSGIKITDLRKIKDCVETIINSCLTSNFDHHDINELQHLINENHSISVHDFVGISKRTITKRGEEYKPSSGEKGLLLLEQLLVSKADAYILDEPEAGLANSYIDSVIRPKISKIGQQKKIVVIATHNANIAVRTLPYCSIYRSHNNGVYKTYIGNPFSNQLVCAEDGETQSWKEKSIYTLEGGEEAFYERKRIYESSKNY